MCCGDSGTFHRVELHHLAGRELVILWFGHSEVGDSVQIRKLGATSNETVSATVSAVKEESDGKVMVTLHLELDVASALDLLSVSRKRRFSSIPPPPAKNEHETTHHEEARTSSAPEDEEDAELSWGWVLSEQKLDELNADARHLLDTPSEGSEPPPQDALQSSTPRLEMARAPRAVPQEPEDYTDIPFLSELEEELDIEIEVEEPDEIGCPEDMAEIDGGAMISVFGESGDQRRVVGFYIDELPVTNKQYSEFLVATDHQNPFGWNSSKPPKDKLDHPIVDVSLDDARAYSKWRKRRLPTSLEWEVVASCFGSQNLPWGDEFSSDYCNCPDSGNGTTTAVTEYPQGASAEGVMDLIGNVWEWTEPSEDMKSKEGYSWVFGGSHRHTCWKRDHLQRTSVATDNTYSYLGFRCVKDIA